MSYTYVCIYCGRQAEACRCRRNAKVAVFLFLVFCLGILIAVAKS